MAEQEVFSLALKNGNPDPTKWPQLTSSTDNQLDLEGSLRLQPGATGSVGIGTTNPSETFGGLTIAHPSVPLAFREIDRAVDQGGLWRMSLDGGILRFDVNTGSQGQVFGRNYLVALAMTKDGNVGIGTTAPPQQLTVTGGIGFANQNAVDKKLYSPIDGLLEWMTHNFALEHGFAVSHQGERRVYFSTAGNSYLTGGNVGIGTTAPVQKLHVADGHVQIELNRSFGLNISDKFIYDKNDIGHYSLGWFSDSWQPGAATAWLSGWAGIKLFTGGSLRFSIDHLGNTRYMGTFRDSSRELKEEITDLSVQEAVSTLKGLNPVTYYLKADEEKNLQLGFIAEEVPDLVASRDHKAISTDHIVAILTKVVKEQQTTIAALTNVVKKQQATIAALAEKVTVLETERS